MGLEKCDYQYAYALRNGKLLLPPGVRVYGQYSIETIHERRKRNREFSGLFVRLSIEVRK